MKPAVATKVSAHVVSAFIGGLSITAIRRHYEAFQGDLSSITPDGFLLAVFFPMITFASLFAIGHFGLRTSGANARTAYPILGAISVLVSAGVWIPYDLVELALADGFLSIIIGLLAGIGSIIGFLHVRSVGYGHKDTESTAFEQAFENKKDQDRFAQSRATHDPLAASTQTETNENPEEIGHFVTDELEFFEGPLQVITSTKAAFTAAVAGALTHSLYSFLVAIVFSDVLSLRNDSALEKFFSGELFTMMAMGIVFSFFICGIILPPAILGLHKYLKSKGKSDASSYIKYGAAAPAVAGLMMLIVGIFLTHWLILPLAVAMGAYHRLAGLEPADLPEDIEVKDRRALVGANHVRRRVHRVVG